MLAHVRTHARTHACTSDFIDAGTVDLEPGSRPARSAIARRRRFPCHTTQAACRAAHAATCVRACVRARVRARERAPVCERARAHTCSVWVWCVRCVCVCTCKCVRACVRACVEIAGFFRDGIPISGGAVRKIPGVEKLVMFVGLGIGKDLVAALMQYYLEPHPRRQGASIMIIVL